MSWILIILLYYGASTVEFNDEQACLVAAKEILSHKNSNASLHAFCAAKGTPATEESLKRPL